MSDHPHHPKAARIASNATRAVEAGQVIPIVWPGDSTEDVAGPPAMDAAEAIRRLVEYLAETGDYEDAGRRVLLLACRLGLPGAPRTTRELGAALGVSHVTAARRLSKVYFKTPSNSRKSRG
jgi:hypothetical protein